MKYLPFYSDTNNICNETCSLKIDLIKANNNSKTSWELFDNSIKTDLGQILKAFKLNLPAQKGALPIDATIKGFINLFNNSGRDIFSLIKHKGRISHLWLISLQIYRRNGNKFLLCCEMKGPAGPARICQIQSIKHQKVNNVEVAVNIYRRIDLWQYLFFGFFSGRFWIYVHGCYSVPDIEFASSIFNVGCRCSGVLAVVVSIVSNDTVTEEDVQHDVRVGLWLPEHVPAQGVAARQSSPDQEMLLLRQEGDEGVEQGHGVLLLLHLPRLQEHLHPRHVGLVTNNFHQRLPRRETTRGTTQ